MDRTSTAHYKESCPQSNPPCMKSSQSPLPWLAWNWGSMSCEEDTEVMAAAIAASSVVICVWPRSLLTSSVSIHKTVPVTCQFVSRVTSQTLQVINNVVGAPTSASTTMPCANTRHDCPRPQRRKGIFSKGQSLVSLRSVSEHTMLPSIGTASSLSSSRELFFIL